jgi:hypothetical protein
MNAEANFHRTDRQGQFVVNAIPVAPEAIVSFDSPVGTGRT